MNLAKLEEFFDAEKVGLLQSAAAQAKGRVVAIGTGATVVMPDWDLLLYVDVARWEIQQRQRRGEAPSIGLDNAKAIPAQLYKRAFFLDWRAADSKRHEIYNKVDLLD